MNLSDRSVVTALDPYEMLRLTEEFPAQCRRALAIAQAAEKVILPRSPRLAVLTGLGGSAAGGDFVRAVFEHEGTIPFLVNRDYHLPKFVDSNTLVFCASYSGNTEETLSAYADAKAVGAMIVVVSSGGQLSEQARADGYPVITVPGGQPPRTAMGFMMVPVLWTCESLDLVAPQDYDEAFSELEAGQKNWTVEGSDARAKNLAAQLYGGLPIVYGLGSWQGLIANRWRSQINENAKQLTFFNTYPELNHNEILGWVNAGKQGVSKFVGVRLDDTEAGAKMSTRAKVTEALIGDTCPFVGVSGTGTRLLSKMLTLAYFGDFVSIYLARLNEVDPENIDSINTLKSELGKV